MSAAGLRARASARWRPPRDYSVVESYAPTGGADGAAFFDFDKTLLHGDAAIIFGHTMARWIYEQGNTLSPPARVLWYAYLSKRFGGLVAREAAYKTLNKLRILKRSRVVELGYRAMAGLPARYLSEHMERMWEDELSRRLYPQMREIMDKHRKLGQRVVIVSTGVREIVEHARRYLGDVDVIAVDMAQENGYWTGHVVGPLYGEDKAALVREYAARHGVRLASSYAYSDHYSDIAFLKAVGHPVVVNPTGRLRRTAQRRGWRILDLPEPPPPAEREPMADAGGHEAPKTP